MEERTKRKYNLESKVSTFDRKKVLANANGNENMVEFAYRLCKCLDDNGENESDLADTLDIGKASINAYIKAEQVPSVEKLIKLAKHFNVSTDYLLGLINTPSIKEDYKLINKTTGLSEKAIDTLNEYLINHKDAVKNDEQQSTFSKVIDTINFLIENDYRFHFFINLNSFLWFDIIHRNELKNNALIYDEDLKKHFDYQRLFKLIELDLYDSLYKIKNELETNNK